MRDPIADLHDEVAERVYARGREIAFTTALVSHRLLNAALVAVHADGTKEQFLEIARMAFESAQRTLDGHAAKYLDARRHLLPGADADDEEEET